MLRICWSAVALISLLGGINQGLASNVMLAWNASTTTDITAYRVYYGAASHTYTNVLQVGNLTNATISGLVQGVTYYFAVTALNSAGLESVLSSEISYAVQAANTAPTISSIASQTIPVNTATAPLAFTVGDAQTPNSNLVVSAASSNPVLVPASGIRLGGSGASRSVTVTPAANQTGTATITLTVSDGALTASTSFLLTVTSVSPVVALGSPTSGSSYTAPAVINLSASVTANGHTINSVRFYSGTNLLAQIATAPYVFAWSNVPAGNYSLFAQATYDGTSTIASASATVTVAGLAPPWQTASVGSPGLAGDATISSGLYTLQGAGNISGSADNFTFLYQALSGDGQVTAQLGSFSNGGKAGRLGVMIREALTSGSRSTFMGIDGSGGYRFQRRSSTSGGTSTTRSGSCSLPNGWVRLVRSGNVVTAYKSSDGKTWTMVNSCKVTMAANIYVGLAIASGSTTTLSAGSFTNVAVIP